MKYKKKSKELIGESISCLLTFMFVQDEDTQLDSVIGLDHMFAIEEDNESIVHFKLDTLVKEGLIAKLVTMCDDINPQNRAKSLKVISQVTSFENKLVEDTLVKVGFFEKAAKFIQEEGLNNSEMLKVYLFVISNMLAERNGECIEAFMDNEILPTILTIAQNRPTDEIWRENAWVISNLIESLSVENRIKYD